MFEPLPEYRGVCPFLLVTSNGAHYHPIPIPRKTPPAIRAEIFQLLENLGEDLPDLTPRSFLRHPTVKSYVLQKLPDVLLPTLSDVHVSLANRSHIKTYIAQAKAQHFPRGTGWEGGYCIIVYSYMGFPDDLVGLIALKAQQDLHVPPEEHYIRHIAQLDAAGLSEHEEDDSSDCLDQDLRVVVCMSKAGSERLLQAQYVQSDIGFKRVVGFHEFEMACVDRDANTSRLISIHPLAFINDFFRCGFLSCISQSTNSGSTCLYIPTD